MPWQRKAGKDPAFLLHRIRWAFDRGWKGHRSVPLLEAEQGSPFFFPIDPVTQNQLVGRFVSVTRRPYVVVEGVT